MTVFLAILLSLLTLCFIVYPLFRCGRPATTASRPMPRQPATPPATDDALEAEIEAQVKILRRAPADFCAGCGGSLKVDDRFCQRCGQRVN